MYILEANVVLIGMPGAGKSTVGVILAKALGAPFLDIDLIIQQKQGRLLQDIINNDGIKKFLDIEEEAALSLDLTNYVIATGGSVVYSEKSMHHLKECGGVVVYLELGYDEIENRINNIKSRGIALNPGQSLHDLYLERLPLYKKYADIVICCSDKNTEEVVEDIINRLNAL